MSSRTERWRRVKGWPGWAMVAVAVIALLAVGATRERGVRTPEERVEAISRRLACPICDGESVFESRNNASASIRQEIRAQVGSGLRSDDDIISFVEQRYSASVLLVPRATGIDALVWALPVAAFVCAVAGLAFTFRRWKLATHDVPSDDDRSRVDRALRDDLDEP
jgi:cytochrome c-type biogenesis protein CcmH